MRAYGWVNHVPMPWLREKGENGTLFRLLCIISVIGHPMNLYKVKKSDEMSG